VQKRRGSVIVWEWEVVHVSLCLALTVETVTPGSRFARHSLAYEEGHVSRPKKADKRFPARLSSQTLRERAPC